MVKRTILLFQPFLRVHILNFAEALTNFRYLLEQPPTFANNQAFYRIVAATPEAEFTRNKVTFVTRLRRLLGIPNIRFKLTRRADLLFTYGCLLITNKPYCVYIENGVTLFNYDAAIARNPIARLIFALLVRLPQCKTLIFMSETALKSLLATARFDRATERVIRRKAAQIYPFVRDPNNATPKRAGKTLRLLFTGNYYVKGGVETLHAFAKLRRKHRNLLLTVVTPLHYLKPEDRHALETMLGVTLRDAALSKEEMAAVYKEHDVFLFPTFRDTFGLVLIEALAHGLPVIAVDQYAVTEMITDGWNGFVFPDHPLTDYDRTTYRMYGHLYNAKDFYRALFAAQRDGRMRPIEAFIARSVREYLKHPALLSEHSEHALKRYRERFSARVTSQRIEQAFEESLA